MNIPKLILSIALPFVAGAIGSYFTYSAITVWYANLEKPFFNPPNFVFGPVWTILYILMGLSFYLVWNSKDAKTKRSAIQMFLIQLALNTVWSIAFFGLKSPVLGFITIILLWGAIFLTIQHFGKISKAASYLLYPYLAWVSFAALLNFSIMLLN